MITLIIVLAFTAFKLTTLVANYKAQEKLEEAMYAEAKKSNDLTLIMVVAFRQSETSARRAILENIITIIIFALGSILASLISIHFKLFG